MDKYLGVALLLALEAYALFEVFAVSHRRGRGPRDA